MRIFLSVNGPETLRKIARFFSVLTNLAGFADCRVLPSAAAVWLGPRSAEKGHGGLTQMVKSESVALPVRATSLRGISKMYGLGKSTLRKAINEGRLRAVRIGRRTVIRIDDAEAFIAGGEEIAPAHSENAPAPAKRKGPRREK